METRLHTRTGARELLATRVAHGITATDLRMMVGRVLHETGVAPHPDNLTRAALQATSTRSP